MRCMLDVATIIQFTPRQSTVTLRGVQYVQRTVNPEKRKLSTHKN